MAEMSGKKMAAETSRRPVGWNTVSVIFVLFLFMVLAIAFYLVAASMSPGGKGWNPFAGLGPSGLGNHSCTMSTDCRGPWFWQPGGQICISGRSCMCGPDVQYGGSDTCTCECGGSTAGVCVDYTGTPAAGKECALREHACSMGPGLVEQAPLCCPGDVCVDGICTAPGAGWLAKCRIRED